MDAHILIIDDDQADAAATKTHFELCGFAVTCEPDFANGPSVASGGSFDAIILDIGGPADSQGRLTYPGWDVLQKLRSDSTTGNTPVIVCTVHASEYRHWKTALNTHVHILEKNADLTYVMLQDLVESAIAKVRQNADTLESAHYALDIVGGALTINGVCASELGFTPTPRQMRAITLLRRHAPYVVRRETFVEERISRSPAATGKLITRLNESLAKVNSDVHYIGAVHGVGYVLLSMATLPNQRTIT